MSDIEGFRDDVVDSVGSLLYTGSDTNNAFFHSHDGDGYLAGFADGIASAPQPDDTAPTITFISPTPGVAPGQPGGFPADPNAAKSTPIVIQISDVDPGVQYVNVVVRYTDSEGTEIEETVYRRSNFRGRYVKGSKAELVGGSLQLTIKRNGGWLELITGASRQFGFFVDAVDEDGNLNEES